MPAMAKFSALIICYRKLKSEPMGSFSIFADTEEIWGVRDRRRSLSKEISGVRPVIAVLLRFETTFLSKI